MGDLGNSSRAPSCPPPALPHPGSSGDRPEFRSTPSVLTQKRSDGRGGSPVCVVQTHPWARKTTSPSSALASRTPGRGGRGGAAPVRSPAAPLGELEDETLLCAFPSRTPGRERGRSRREQPSPAQSHGQLLEVHQQERHAPRSCHRQHQRSRGCRRGRRRAGVSHRPTSWAPDTPITRRGHARGRCDPKRPHGAGATGGQPRRPTPGVLPAHPATCHAPGIPRGLERAPGTSCGDGARWPFVWLPPASFATPTAPQALPARTPATAPARPHPRRSTAAVGR